MLMKTVQSINELLDFGNNKFSSFTNNIRKYCRFDNFSSSTRFKLKLNLICYQTRIKKKNYFIILSNIVPFDKKLRKFDKISFKFDPIYVLPYV